MHTILYNYIIVQYCSYNMGLHTLHIDRSQMPMDSMVSPARWSLWTGACWELWRARSTRIISCGSSQADRLRIDPKKPVTENGTSTKKGCFLAGYSRWDIHGTMWFLPSNMFRNVQFPCENQNQGFVVSVSLNLQPLSGCQDDQTSADAHVEGGGAKKMARLNFCDKTSFLWFHHPPKYGFIYHNFCEQVVSPLQRHLPGRIHLGVVESLEGWYLDRGLPHPNGPIEGQLGGGPLQAGAGLVYHPWALLGLLFLRQAEGFQLCYRGMTCGDLMFCQLKDARIAEPRMFHTFGQRHVF